MDEQAPRLEIGRDGEVHHEVALDGETVTVGRGSSTFQPDIELDDPGSWVSRRHCMILQAWGSWWVEDCDSRNGTFIRRSDEVTRVVGRTQLTTRDVVCITADADQSGPTSLWELKLDDPSATRTIDQSLTASGPSSGVKPCVRWASDEMRVEVLGTGETRQVELRPQGYDLIAHMARRNAESGSESVVCTTDELLEAVWGATETWDPYRPPTTDNLRDLVLTVRKAIEPDASNPVILENQRGVGYRLRTAQP